MPRPTIARECICRHCGRSFTLPQWRITQGRGTYCSFACGKAAITQRQRTAINQRQEKRCPKCGETKPLEDFGKATGRADGRELARLWRKAHPGANSERARRHELAKHNLPGAHTDAEWKALCNSGKGNRQLIDYRVFPFTGEGSAVVLQ